ncbi:MAG: hypothetical protein KA191_04035 [Verrucomicrobia bacterium]|jgi:hypothetical protein|nr:hypothetical protein [Verrucomicrobiota bacterium]OQC67394.1 MAG: hypothetical protein BWX48_00759 [Verrucomicrobia bacterium ADurb.Bin006]NMD19627.1 hypothetical protein [Verrucomicrobiota bacterium]HOF47569.1 hypothetical protein [Verrucomicrobiota bacterium]HOG87062.1 hypothetical protein [Verrucomicrobiota bacterium]
MDHNRWYQPRGPVLLWGQQNVGADDFAVFMHARGFDRHSQRILEIPNVLRSLSV